MAKRFDALGQAEECLGHIWNSDLQPNVLDLHRMDDEPLTMVVSVAGPSADVTAQSDELMALGFEAGATLDYDAKYRSRTNHRNCCPRKIDRHLGQLWKGILWHEPGTA